MKSDAKSEFKKGGQQCSWYLCCDRVGIQIRSCDEASPLGAAASTQPGYVAAAGTHREALGAGNPGNHQFPRQAQHLSWIQPIEYLHKKEGIKMTEKTFNVMHYFLSRKKSTSFRSWPEQTWVDPGGFHSNSPSSEPGSPATVSNHNVLPDLCAKQWTCLLLHFTLLGVRRQFQDHTQYLPVNYLLITSIFILLSSWWLKSSSSHWLNVISVHKIAYFVFLKKHNLEMFLWPKTSFSLERPVPGSFPCTAISSNSLGNFMPSEIRSPHVSRSYSSRPKENTSACRL